MDSQPIFASLRDTLAHLYPITESARRIADDAGLDARRIRFSAQALENWHAILGAAVQADKLEALLHIVVAEYDSNRDLLAAYGMYRHFIEQGGRIAPPEPIYGDQGDNATTSAKNVNIGQNITQTTIEGNVDTGGGDVVGRDKITIGTIINNLFRGDSEEVRKLRNRQSMLKLVYDIWVKGVLENSLYNQLLIDLDMEQRPEAVERPWGMVLETPAQANRLLPAGTKIVAVFAELNQSLLILGEPGSGKSTMLLELARDLLRQAEQNPMLPIPVLFNLSSWADKRPPFRQWLIDELREKYHIPKALAQMWVEQDELLLLLDGLDEVKQARREECIKTINEFQQSCKMLVPLALCSRRAEYQALTGKLKLSGAIILHPLTSQQINSFLARAGERLGAVAYLLQSDSKIQALAQSPLTFSILCLTYQDKVITDIKLGSGVETHLQQLFDAYIMRMLQRPGKLTVDQHSRTQTLHWLAWLATKMAQYEQTEFFIERLQPNWLSTSGKSLFPVSFTMFVWGPLYGLLYGTLAGLISGLIGGLTFGSNNALGIGAMTWLVVCMITGLVIGLIAGLSIGLIGSLFDLLRGELNRIRSTEQSNKSWKRLRSSVYIGLFWWLTYALFLGLSGGLFLGKNMIITGLSRGFENGIVFGLIGLLIGGFKPIKLSTKVVKSWRDLRDTLIIGLLIGLSGCTLAWNGLIFERLIFGLIIGGIGGLICGLIFQLDTELNMQSTIVTKTPNEGIKRVSIFLLVIILAFMLIFGLIAGLSLSPTFGAGDRMGMGIISGLIFGLIGGLAANSDILMKHLILRFLLYIRCYAPLNYARFLDYCADRIFLRKVGGGYIFVHRLLMEHFASLTEEDIKRLAAASDRR